MAYSYDQLKQLWISNGGNPAAADVAAAVALAESGGRQDAYNGTGRDNSVGFWQVNYYGSLRNDRTAKFGSPQEMFADPNRQARAAIAISGNGRNWTPWTTYTSGRYKTFLRAPTGVLPLDTGNILSSVTPGSGTPNDVGAPLATDIRVSDEGDLLPPVKLLGSTLAPGISRQSVRRVAGATALVGGGLMIVLVGLRRMVPAKLPALGGATAAGIAWGGYTVGWWGWQAMTNKVPAGPPDTFHWPSIRDLVVPGRIPSTTGTDAGTSTILNPRTGQQYDPRQYSAKNPPPGYTGRITLRG